jgi:hypothetical protein
MRETAVCHNDTHEGKHPLSRLIELSDEEVFKLMCALTEDKTQILEDDALLVVKWAQEIRGAANILAMVLAGELACCVEDGQVKVGLSKRGVQLARQAKAARAAKQAAGSGAPA